MGPEKWEMVGNGSRPSQLWNGDHTHGNTPLGGTTLGGTEPQAYRLPVDLFTTLPACLSAGS